MRTSPREIRLTSLSHGAGCACKIGAAELAPLLERLPRPDDPRLLVGPEKSDDAAVYRLTDELALVQTADFFTPIVDNPHDFGRIAAANALSDVYAMGADPVLALNLVAFSLGDLGQLVLEEILRGGAAVADAAGVAIAGGHSVDDPEPKYGLAVSGVVHPDRVITNAGAEPGDRLLLTKPLGGGLITTGAKRAVATREHVSAAVEVMTELNVAASRRARDANANAMTDVTGFGLLGHLHELCAASGVAAQLEAEAAPAIDGALELASDERCVAGGSRRNAEHAESFTTWAPSVPPERRRLLTDAMTSGGLLVTVPPGRREAAPGVEIGRVVRGASGAISVR